MLPQQMDEDSVLAPLSNSWIISIIGLYMGGCQNYGPFLGPYYNTAPNI